MNETVQKEISNKTYSYDRNGNQIKVTDSKTGETQLMEYDADNRLSIYEEYDNAALVMRKEQRYNGATDVIQEKEVRDGKVTVRNNYYENGSVLYVENEKNQLLYLNLMDENGVVITTEQKTEDAATRRAAAKNSVSIESTAIPFPDIWLDFSATAYSIYPKIFNAGRSSVKATAKVSFANITKKVNLGKVSPLSYSKKKRCIAYLTTAHKQSIKVVFTVSNGAQSVSKVVNGSRKLDQKYIEQWIKGSRKNREASITYHFEKHGQKELHMECIKSYVVQADKFRKALRKMGKRQKKDILRMYISGAGNGRGKEDILC